MAKLANADSRWTQPEIDFLLAEFDGTRATTEVIAELLERTAKACEIRYYEYHQGRTAVAEEKGFPTGTHLAVAAFRRAESLKLGPTCSSCHVELPATRICDTCS